MKIAVKPTLEAPFIAKNASGSIQQRNHDYSKLLKLVSSFRDQSDTLLAETPIASY